MQHPKYLSVPFLKTVSSLVLFSFLLTGCVTTHRPANNIASDHTVDKLVKIDTLAALNNSAMRHVKIVPGKRPHLALFDPTNSEYPRIGIWISNQHETEFPFTQLIASWNAVTPPDTGVRFFVRVRTVDGTWSPWLYTGYWGHPTPVPLTTRFPHGRLDQDTLRLSTPADAWQIKATLESLQTNTKINPTIRRISVVYSGKTKDADLYTKLEIPSAKAATQPTLIDLPVPYRAQGDSADALQNQTCSPTSVTMVMAYWGKNYPLNTNAMAIWDEEYRLFGNWNRAVGRAGEVGLDAWVTRFRNWQQVRATLATGQPIIASIKFKKGEFPSSLLRATNGHLIVIRGMTASGDLICNDPGHRDGGNHVIYKANELAHAWFGHGGVAYIIHGHHPTTRK